MKLLTILPAKAVTKAVSNFFLVGTSVKGTLEWPSYPMHNFPAWRGFLIRPHQRPMRENAL
jgi:hypothetical protein